MQIDRENTGLLFKNNRKREGKQDPNYQGECNIAGQEFYMNAWIKDGQAGKFMSFSFKPKQQKQDPKPHVVAGGKDGAEPDDEIPF